MWCSRIHPMGQASYSMIGGVADRVDRLGERVVVVGLPLHGDDVRRVPSRQSIGSPGRRFRLTVSTPGRPESRSTRRCTHDAPRRHRRLQHEPEPDAVTLGETVERDRRGDRESNATRNRLTFDTRPSTNGGRPPSRPLTSINFGPSAVSLISVWMTASLMPSAAMAASTIANTGACSSGARMPGTKLPVSRNGSGEREATGDRHVTDAAPADHALDREVVREPVVPRQVVGDVLLDHVVGHAASSSLSTASSSSG